jgi:hypothetical protein
MYNLIVSIVFRFLYLYHSGLYFETIESQAWFLSWFPKLLSPLRKPLKKENHGDTDYTEVHRVLLVSTINFVKLRGFVPHRQAQCITLWQKKTCRSGLKIVKQLGQNKNWNKPTRLMVHLGKLVGLIVFNFVRCSELKPIVPW